MQESTSGKAQKCKTFYDRLRNEIIDPLRELQNVHSQTAKNNVKSAKKEIDEFIKLKNKIGSGKMKYFRMMNDVEESLNLYSQIKDIKEYSFEKRGRINQKINVGLKEAKDAERTYKNILMYAKEYRQSYIKSMVRGIYIYMYI